MTTTSTIPQIYPGGAPLYWQAEVSGKLGAAVTHYFYQRPLSPEEIELLRDYMLHWLNCPSMIFQPEVKEALSVQLNQIQTREDISAAIHACLEQGLDPF